MSTTGVVSDTAIEELQQQIPTTPERVPCPKCGKSFLPGGLTLHMALKHGVKSSTPPSATVQARREYQREWRLRRAEKDKRSHHKQTNKSIQNPAKDTRLHGNTTTPESTLDQTRPHVIWLSGYLTSYIEQYCRGYEISIPLVTAGVAEALLPQTGR